jgi:hypothetical protein
VSAERAGWQLLRAATEDDVGVEPLQVDELIRCADDQIARLQDLHLRVGRTVIGA